MILDGAADITQPVSINYRHSAVASGQKLLLINLKIVLLEVTIYLRGVSRELEVCVWIRSSFFTRWDLASCIEIAD